MRIGDAERRARLVDRHHLARTAPGVVEVARDLVALHSSDPVTPYLACRARTSDFAVGDLEHALYESRSLWRLHGMRRTLFVVASQEGPLVVAAAGRDIASAERKRLAGWLAAEQLGSDVGAWLAGVEERIVTVLADGAELRTGELAEPIPELATEVTLGSGKWVTRSPVASRILIVLGMEGRIVRTRPVGSWRSSQYRWTSTEAWFGQQEGAPDPDVARAELVRRYLASHGPATVTDIRWWTGWTARRTAAALDRLDTVTVALDGGEGLVLADDVDRHEGDVDTVALLPGLDPTPMGWKERDWYLGDHAPAVFDRNGNVGPTVWVGGRIVGGWAQRPSGDVVVRLLEDVGSEAAARIDEEAARLTDWFAGQVVAPRFRTPLERELSE